jgi:hypothetical protein
MATSKSIAGLIGPTTIAIALSESINLPVMWANVTPSVIYLNGSLLFVGGLAIVRAHNRWVADWPVLITLTGWFILLAGLIRMFAPVQAQRGAENGAAVYPGLAVLLALGIFLTFKGYVPRENSPAS